MSLIANTCPNCKAPISLEVRPQHFYTCFTCKKPFIANDLTLKESIVIYSETLSPIVIGSKGKIKSDSFEITGCITLFQNNTVINLYCILWQHGLYGYLIEHEGRYSITDFIDENPSKELRTVKLGKNTSIGKYGELYCNSSSKVERIALSGEGKIYFPSMKNSLFCTFSRPDKKAYYAIFSKTESYFLHGSFYELEELNLSRTRATYSWNSLKTFPAPLSLSCPDCHKEIKAFTHYKARQLSCEFCGCVSHFEKEGKLGRKIKQLPTIQQCTFKLGTVFVIEELEFVLINFVVKRETTYSTIWTEFSLFNPTKGVWILNESDGHYNLMKPTDFYVSDTMKILRDVSKDRINFQLYSKYKYTIKHAAGEFLSDALTSTLPNCADYTAPPQILSYENTSDEIIWFQGEYCDHSTVKSWLKEKAILPNKEGIAPNQPFISNFDPDSLTRLSVIAFLLVVIIQIILSAAVTTSQPVYTKSFGDVDTTNTRVIVSDPFFISENNCAVDVILNSDINNTWLESDFTLVNETTGDQYYFSKAIEYYSGIADGESWSEGSKEETVTVNSVKKGKYHLNILLSTDGAISYHELNVRVIENVPLLKNFLITLAAFVIFPAFIFYRRRVFDRKQWYNSNYSPYTYD